MTNLLETYLRVRLPLFLPILVLVFTVSTPSRFEGYDQQVASGPKRVPIQENKWRHRRFCFALATVRDRRKFTTPLRDCCSNLLFARSSTQMNGFFSEPANHGSPSAVCWPCGKNSNSICRWRDGFFFRFTMAMLRLSRRGSLIEFELPSFLWRLTLWFPRNLMTIQYCWKV